MNKRKIILLAMALCMVAILAVGGTLAYFTDTEQARNTMVIGNVQINIEEFTYMADENGNRAWKPFADNEFVMYPINNDQGFELYNKMVHTFNTSSSQDDAYIRTIVLFEANTELDGNFVGEGETCFPGIHFGYNNVLGPQTSAADSKKYYGSTNYTLEDTVTIDGVKYWVAVFTVADNESAIPYDACLNTLASVWMDKNVTLDQSKGWGEDGKVDIIVFSQGIQATGLTHEQAMTELGEVNATNLQSWIGEDDAVINDWSDKANTNN